VSGAKSQASLREHGPDHAVLITGAAGAIGGATVRAFLDRGMAVLGVDRLEHSDMAQERDYTHVVAELTNPEATRSAIDAALRPLPPLAHVIGIAGGALPGEPESQDEPDRLTPELFRASIEANLTTQFTIVHGSIPHLLNAPGDNRSITLTSSFNALSAQGMPAYSAAKAGLAGLMYGLVRPLGRLRIRINVVAPGTVRTPRTERLWAPVPGHFERLEAGSALGRLAKPADVAAAFTALALDLRKVTGQVLVVDGGQTVVHL
jgi:NAD(P)-dependent dehydrogenase (short-subunit alcohol dehydrogenase family)